MTYKRFIKACILGDLKTVKLFPRYTSLQYACQGGNLDIVNIMLSKGDNDYYEGLEGAAEGGHINLVELMFSLGSPTIFYGIKGACKGGNYDIFKFLLNKDIETRFCDLIEHACRGGNLSIINFIINYLIENDYDYKYTWDSGLYGACQGGHPLIIELMISKGANDWNYGMVGACEGGHPLIIELMISKGADDWDSGLTSACWAGNTLLANIMISNGATNFYDALYSACKGGNMNTFDFLIDRFISQGQSYDCYNIMMGLNHGNKNVEFINFIISKIGETFSKKSSISENYFNYLSRILIFKYIQMFTIKQLNIPLDLIV